jgi:predicted nucleic acid-binding Zn finger protein
MQQLQVEHKKIPKPTSQTKVVGNEQKEEYENKREGHGRNIALTRKVFRLENSDTFYVESGSTDNVFYFVRYNFSGFQWCSCPDNSTRGIRCKHQFAIEYAIRLGTLKDIDKLPAEAKRYGSTTTTTTAITSKSYRDDDYDF